MLVKNVLLIKKKKIGSPENTNYFLKKVENTKGKNLVKNSIECCATYMQFSILKMLFAQLSGNI